MTDTVVPTAPVTLPPATIGAALDAAARALTAAGVERPRLEARVLVGEALGVGVETVLGYPERTLDEAARRRLGGLLDRRLAREPMSHILGRREFWSLSFAVTADTLTPRPDSETLIEAALAVTDESEVAPRVLDLGTGSGCLLLTLLHERPGATGIGVDLSEAAVAVAAENARSLELEDRASFVRGDWASALPDGGFDVIVCNPPYIPDSDIDALTPEVARYEPRLALAGGVDGLDAYRRLLPEASRLLAGNGVALFEVGAGQAAAVAALATAAGLCEVAVHRDLSGIERVVSARLQRPAADAKKRLE